MTTTRLAVCRNAEVSIVAHYDLPTGERLVPYSVTNNLIATNCVLLPSDVEDFGGKEELLDAVRAYIHRYVDLTPIFEEIAAHYVLLTWVYDAFNELPYLRLRGDYGTGKTRGLMTIGSICYKPFFASGASTVSPIFHVLDAMGATLILDEADLRFSDATADLTKLLNNGHVRGLPILRTMTNRHHELNPRAFRVFGPKIVGMRNNFNDPALESRFLTEETGNRALRKDVPIHTPDQLHADAVQLRNRLLAWRFHARHQVGPDLTRLIEGLEPRRNQIALSLLSLVDDGDLRERVRHELVGAEARVLQERASTLEATMLRCLLEVFNSSKASFASVSDVTRRFNQAAEAEIGKLVTAKWAGSFMRTKLKLETIKTGGVYVVPCTERSKIHVLAKRYGITMPIPAAIQR